MRACRHNLDVEEAQSYLARFVADHGADEKILKEEEETAAKARAESIVRRSYALQPCPNWSKNQAFLDLIGELCW